MMSVTELIKQTVVYYCNITGNTIDDYFSGLDRVDSEELVNQGGADWLLHLELNTLSKLGITTEVIKSNEVKVRAYINGIVDMDSVVPHIWLKEAFGYIENTVPDDCLLWSHNEVVNLLKGYASDKIFVSAYNKDTVNKLSINDNGVFQFDLFNTEINDIFAENYLSTLPAEIKDCIENDKPIYLEMACLNEKPIRSDMSKVMQTENILFDYEDFSKFSKVLYFQYLYQIMCLGVQFELKNFYFGVFLPVDFFTTDFAKLFNRAFEFESGFIDDKDKNFVFVIYKSRGEFLDNDAEDVYNIDKKVFTVEGRIETKQTANFNTDESILLKDWVKDTTGNYYIDVPKLTIPAELKRNNGVIVTDKQLNSALGMMANSSLSEISITTLPYKPGSISITKDNFWRCVAAFTFRRLYNTNTTYANRVFYAPNVNIEGYDKWIHNALILFLFDSNNKAYSYRVNDTAYHNKFFCLKPERVREVCKDERVLKDLDETGSDNDFILQALEESKSYLTTTAAKLYQFVEMYIEVAYQHRSDVFEWDAGLLQLQRDFWSEDKFGRYYNLFVEALADELRVNAKLFGFVKEF